MRNTFLSSALLASAYATAEPLAEIAPKPLDLPLLAEGVGWGVVVGFGVIFSVITVFLVNIEAKASGRQTVTSEWFNTAGRTVGTGLTAAVIVSQWTWAATLLQSSNVAWKYGISGPFWYASGASIQIVLFAILAIELKRKAPNCRTFLEIIRVRWGNTAHKVFLVFGLLANMIVTGMLLLGGSAVVHSLTGMNQRVCCFMIPLGVIAYTLSGGLKATFLASYVHTFLIYLFMLIFMFAIYTTDKQLGSVKAVYDGLENAAKMIMARSPAMTDVADRREFLEGNAGNSFLTMASEGGLIFGVINIVGNFGTVFVDQSYWQSAIASRPTCAVQGFILGGLSWFAIPFCMATSLGLANIAMFIPTAVANAGDGLVPPFTAVELFGKSGAWMVLIQLFMAVTSTGSAELIAVSSLITYDVYRAYIKPDATGEELLKVSRIGVAVFGVFMGIFGVILDVLGLNLGWVYLAMGIIIGSAVAPISSVLMSRWVTGPAAISGAVGGLFFALLTWMLQAKAEAGEITVDSLGGDYPMLYGNIVAILGSAAITGLVTLYSMYMGDNTTPYDFEATRNIELVDDTIAKPEESEDEYQEKLTNLYYLARNFGIVAALILLVIWPLPMHWSDYVFGLGFFRFWVALAFIWALMATFAVVVYPVYENRVVLANVFTFLGGGGEAGSKTPDNVADTFETRPHDGSA